jgi:hypothetical protein
VAFARRAVEESAGQADWLVASSAEGMARAYAAAGDEARRVEWIARASELVSVVTDDEDREIVAGQLATVPPVRGGLLGPN